jgi:hypothetical protein
MGRSESSDRRGMVRGLDVVDEMKVWRIVGDLSAGLGVCLIGVVPSING